MTLQDLRAKVAAGYYVKRIPWDHISDVRPMAQAEGYIMLRRVVRGGAMPFVRSKKDVLARLDALIQEERG